MASHGGSDLPDRYLSQWKTVWNRNRREQARDNRNRLRQLPACVVRSHSCLDVENVQVSHSGSVMEHGLRLHLPVGGVEDRPFRRDGADRHRAGIDLNRTDGHGRRAGACGMRRVEPAWVRFYPAAIFSDPDFLAIFSAPLRKSSNSEEAINETTLRVVPPTPPMEPILHKFAWK